MEDEKHRSMNMTIKKVLILTSMLLIGMLECVAQSAQPQIEGFWGVKLGGTESTVTTKVKQSYPSAYYDREVTGHPFRVKNCKLAGLDVDDCQFKFSNGVFSEAKFVKTAGGRFVNASNAQSFVSSLTPQMQSDYQDFCEAISQKYGTPKVSGQTATWRTSNGNSITVKPWTNISSYVMDDGTTWAATGIYIIYSKGSHLNDF